MQNDADKPPATRPKIKYKRDIRKRSPGGSKKRITPRQRQAIELIVCQGFTFERAAESVGLHINSLRRALGKKHVIQYKNDVFRAFRDGLAEKSIARLDVLADTAKSESVKADCNKSLIQLDDRFQPQQTVNHKHSGEIRHTPGYVIDLSEDPAPVLISDQVPPVIDVQLDQALDQMRSTLESVDPA